MWEGRNSEWVRIINKNIEEHSRYLGTKMEHPSDKYIILTLQGVLLAMQVPVEGAMVCPPITRERG